MLDVHMCILTSYEHCDSSRDQIRLRIHCHRRFMISDIWRKRIGVVGRLKVFAQIISPDFRNFRLELSKLILLDTYSM